MENGWRWSAGARQKCRSISSLYVIKIADRYHQGLFYYEFLSDFFPNFQLPGNLSFLAFSAFPHSVSYEPPTLLLGQMIVPEGVFCQKKIHENIPDGTDFKVRGILHKPRSDVENCENGRPIR